MSANKIDLHRLSTCAVRIPPPIIKSENQIAAAGLYEIHDARPRFALFLHDHTLGALICDGWISINQLGDRESAMKFLRYWTGDRGLEVIEGEQDDD